MIENDVIDCKASILTTGCRAGIANFLWRTLRSITRSNAQVLHQHIMSLYFQSVTCEGDAGLRCRLPGDGHKRVSDLKL